MAVFRNRLYVVITLVAFFAATLGPLLPHSAAAAQPCAMMMSMDNGHAARGMMPACADMSCLIMCTLPAPVSTSSTAFAWSAVQYATADDVRSGRTVPPAQSPPIA